MIIAVVILMILAWTYSGWIIGFRAWARLNNGEIRLEDVPALAIIFAILGPLTVSIGKKNDVDDFESGC